MVIIITDDYYRVYSLYLHIFYFPLIICCNTKALPIELILRSQHLLYGLGIFKLCISILCVPIYCVRMCTYILYTMCTHSPILPK